MISTRPVITGLVFYRMGASMKIKYQLNRDSINEFYQHQALMDKSIHNKMVTLLIAIIVMLTLVVFLLFKVNTYTIFAAVSFALLMIVVFPKIYWRIIQDRISKKIQQFPLSYNEIILELINNVLYVSNNNKQFKLRQQDIKNSFITQNSTILYYQEEAALNILVIPNQLIDREKELESFIKGIQYE